MSFQKKGNKNIHILYKKINFTLGSNNECREGKTKKRKKEKCSALYENNTVHYSIYTLVLQLLFHCVDNLQLRYCRQSLPKKTRNVSEK